MIKNSIVVLLTLLIVGCNSSQKKEETPREELVLTLSEAEKIIDLPLHCIEIEYPNKLGQVLGSDADLKTPKELRPIFYGCFDWHSSVHGYWSIVELMKHFPELNEKHNIKARLNTLITDENAQIELAFFEGPNNKNFERTYGWAWLFQLHGALLTWEDVDAQRWARTIEPLANLLIERYETYLPKLNYPIRTGTHDNTAFGLSLTLDYARLIQNKQLEELIINTAQRLYSKDNNCNLAFEPSGHDFLSPCLEEARLMGKVLHTKEYKTWLNNFLPDLFQPNFTLEVGKVSDRTDGHLVHLDGLNFSRARCLLEISNKIPELSYLKTVANNHFNASFNNITNDDYMGSHWLGTFALYTLLEK